VRTWVEGSTPSSETFFMPIGYKVVSVDCGKIFSFNFELKHEAYTIYTPYKWTRRKHGFGPLALFKDLDTAIRFRKAYCMYDNSLQVFKCRYMPSNDNALWYPYIHVSSGMLHTSSRHNLPAGTILADMIKLLP